MVKHVVVGKEPEAMAQLDSDVEHESDREVPLRWPTKRSIWKPEVQQYDERQSQTWEGVRAGEEASAASALQGGQTTPAQFIRLSPRVQHQTGSLLFRTTL